MGSAGMEIIPTGFGGSQGIMDAVEKSAMIEYIYYNQFSVRSISPENLLLLKEKLHAFEPSFQQDKPQEGVWSQKIAHHEEALRLNLQSIYDFFVQTGAIVEGEMPPLASSENGVLEIQIDREKCAFCYPKVIQKQIVCEWKDVYLFMSHKPVSPYGNFLILPKRHQCAWDLTPEETIASFELIVALKQVLQETTGCDDWVCYVQDGPSVGQTVPHTHIHFFIPPSPLKASISELQHIHNQRPILSYDEMRMHCEKIKPLLLSKLHIRN
jgi:diadenosine tetraphosphate (Ap4A) HIT family hydrolase